MISEADKEFLSNMESLGILKRMGSENIPMYLVGHLMYNELNGQHLSRILKILRPAIVAISVDPKRFPTTQEYIIDDNSMYRNDLQRLRTTSVNFGTSVDSRFWRPFFFNGWKGYLASMQSFLNLHIPFPSDSSVLSPLYNTHFQILYAAKDIGAQLITFDRDTSITMDRLNCRSSTPSAYANLYCMRASFLISCLISLFTKYSRADFESRLNRIFVPGMDPPYASSPIPSRVSRVESIPISNSLNASIATYRYICQMTRHHKSWKEEMVFNSRWCYQVLVRECGSVVADKLKIVDSLPYNHNFNLKDKFGEGGMVCVADYSLFDSISKRFEDKAIMLKDRQLNIKLLNQRQEITKEMGVETCGGRYSNDKLFSDYVDGFNFGFLTFAGIVLVVSPILAVGLLGKAAVTKNRRYLFDTSAKY